MTEDNDAKLEIDWVKTIAGALAAVSSAVLLSTLGAAGTLIGAALGSVIVTVGGALYSQGLATSRQQLARAQSAARLHVGIAQAELRRAHRENGDTATVDSHVVEAEERLDEAQEDLDALDDQPAGPGWRERVRVLPWKRISLVAAGLFAAAIVAITAFELATGDSVSEITGGTSEGDGGTTISHIGGGGADEKAEDDGTPTDEQEPAGEPGDEQPAEPSGEPAPESSPAPSDVPTSEPTLPSETAEPSAETPTASID
jgi:hypothetical protein